MVVAVLAVAAGGNAEERVAAFEAETALFSSSSCCVVGVAGTQWGVSASLLAQTLAPWAGRGL